MAALRQRLGGLVVPERFGGLGHGLLAVAQVGEVTGRACASTSICFGMHLAGSAVIAAKATPEQQERYLRPIAAGEHLTTLALSEPATGGEFWLPQTRMEHSRPGRLRLTGTKSFVTNAAHADSYVLSAVAADPGIPPGLFSCAVLDAGTAGQVWGEPWTGFGMRGNSSRSLELRGVDIPQSRLLGEEGDQIWYVFNVVAPYFLMAMAGTYLGVAAAALEEARAHLAAAPARPLRPGPGLAAGRPAPAGVDVGPGGAHPAADLPRGRGGGGRRRGGADGAGVREGRGRRGGGARHQRRPDPGRRHRLRPGLPLHRMLRDARAAHVMAPTTDVLRIWTGRALLDEPLLEG